MEFKKVFSQDEKSSYVIDIPGIQSCLAKIQDSRNKLITAIAAVKTCSFQRSEFVGFYEGYEEDLRGIASMLGNYETLYQSALTVNVSDLANATRLVKQDQLKFQEAIEVITERSKSTLVRMDIINKSLDVIKSKQDFGELALAVRTLSILALIGVTIFCAILTYKVRKSKPPPFPMTQAQHTVSRSQRNKYQVNRAARRNLDR